MIPQGIELFVATEPVDRRLGSERLSGLVRERLQREPPARGAMFVFFGKRKHTLKALWWDGSGVVLLSKKLHHSVFEISLPTEKGDRAVVLSEVAFEALFAGLQRMIH